MLSYLTLKPHNIIILHKCIFGILHTSIKKTNIALISSKKLLAKILLLLSCITLIPNVNTVRMSFKMKAIDRSIIALYTPGPATFALSFV